MKINFEDKSYIELIKSKTPGNVLFSIVARDPNHPTTTVATSVELTKEQFVQLINELVKMRD